MNQNYVQNSYQYYDLLIYDLNDKVRINET